MYSKIAIPKADNQCAQNVSQQETGSSIRILPAVSPIQQKPIDSKSEPIQRDTIDEEPLQGKFEPVQKVKEKKPLQGKFEIVQKKTNQNAQLESSKAASVTAPTKNNSGLPDKLKSGIENISGIGMEDVKVHYNSDKPAQLNALAYAQGTDIHVASNQERHLPHEAWHVVQQKQGRVKPTMQMKQGVPVNDDAGLEKEADVMGAQATARGNEINTVQKIEAKQVKNVIPYTIQRLDSPFGKSRSTITDENDDDSHETEKKMTEKGGEIPLKDQFQDEGSDNQSKSDPLKWEGYFGKDFDYQRAKHPEMSPGLGMVKAGPRIGKFGLLRAIDSLGLAKSGMSKSAELAMAPAMWSKGKMDQTDSKWKKLGYGALGVFGSLFSGAAGLVGGIGSAVLGGLGAAGSAIGGATVGAATSLGGGVLTALGGLFGGAKYAGKYIKEAYNKFNVKEDGLGRYSGSNAGGSRENYLQTTNAELAGYGIKAFSAAGSVGSSLTNKIAGGIDGKTIAESGFASNHAGAADAFGSLGAISGIVGAVASTKEAFHSGGEVIDSSMRTGDRVEAAAKAASSLADATRASADAAWNIAALVNAKGAAVAGAQLAGGGAGIAMGSIDIIRGGYGIWKAGDRLATLIAIENTSEDKKVKNLAKHAIDQQERARVEGGSNIVKGALSVAGGALIVKAVLAGALIGAVAVTPVGLALALGAAAVGVGYALYNYIKKKESKKQFVIDELGIREEMDEWNKEIEKIKEETSYFSKERDERLEKHETEHPNPLEKKLKEHKFKDVGHCYSTFIDASATKIYEEGVKNGNEEYVSILSGMGLKVDKTDPNKPKPEIEKIAKALSK